MKQSKLTHKEMKKMADEVKALSGRYNSISEVTKSVINVIKEL